MTNGSFLRYLRFIIPFPIVIIRIVQVPRTRKAAESTCSRLSIKLWTWYKALPATISLPPNRQRGTSMAQRFHSPTASLLQESWLPITLSWTRNQSKVLDPIREAAVVAWTISGIFAKVNAAIDYHDHEHFGLRSTFCFSVFFFFINFFIIYCCDNNCISLLLSKTKTNWRKLILHTISLLSFYLI